MTDRVFRPLYLIEELGENGLLPDGAIINAGGTTGPTFTVGGRPLMFADGSSTGPGGGGVTLQVAYDASSDGNIDLSAGKNFSITALNSRVFRIDAATGKVTIEGDLEVLGDSVIIDRVIENVDQLNIRMPNATTVGFDIRPAVGVVPTANLLEVRNSNGGSPVLWVDAAGDLHAQNLVLGGTINGINLPAFYASFLAHTDLLSPTPVRHTAEQISVEGPFTNIGAPTTVQEAIEVIDSLLGSGGGGNADSGLFFLNAAPTGSGQVGSKVYVPGTVPVNRVISQGTTDVDAVTVTLLVEGDRSFYSPTVTITTVPAQLGGPITATLTEDPSDKRTFSAVAAIQVPVDTVVSATASTGAVATMTLIRAAAGPAFVLLTQGPYPGAQTAVKAGDTLTVSGSVDNSATYAELLANGANSALVVLTLGAPNSAGAGYRTITGSFTVSNLTGNQYVQARASNTFGTFGGTSTSSNTRLLDQVYPTIGARTITYPVGQLALKGTEAATVSATITNLDTVLYTGVNLTITDPTTYTVTKTATRSGGTYVVGVNNYTISATRTANAATSTASAAVAIADVAPTAAITIVGNPPRLLSSPSGNNYTITITANQQLLSAPSLSASSGTWLGSWTGSGTTWTRTLRIVDTDPKGAQLFSSLSVTGLAGLVGSTITSGAAYTVGGFVLRTITFPPFARFAPIGTSVSDFSKVNAQYTGSTVLTRFPDTGDHFQGFSIVDSLGNFDPAGDHLFISDAAFAGSNTSGTLTLDVWEDA